MTYPELDNKKLTRLRKLLIEHFDLKEMRILCFDLDLDYEELDGGTKSTMMQDLITYLERRGELQRLLDEVKVQRPNIAWPAAEDKSGLDSPKEENAFHRFWLSLVTSGPLNYIHPHQPERKEVLGGKRYYERTGYALLNSSFNSHRNDKFKLPVIEHYDSLNADVEYFKNFDVLLSGGPISNRFTNEYFDRFRGLRYVLGYVRPGLEDAYLIDRANCKPYCVEYGILKSGKRDVVKDFGCLTVMVNPYNTSKKIIAAMGIRGAGTYGCYVVLSEPRYLAQLVSLIEISPESPGYQIVIRYDVGNKGPTVTILEESLHYITDEPYVGIKKNA